MWWLINIEAVTEWKYCMCRDTCVWCVCLKAPQLTEQVLNITPHLFSMLTAAALAYRRYLYFWRRCVIDVEACDAWVHISLVTGFSI